ncbi:hypothetical protein NMY22_g2603 [Coprinellus aureogranulatus]|nr:hypothetical protein NMY22_g2603 [Coprinellus aureogranulatus]
MKGFFAIAFVALQAMVLLPTFVVGQECTQYCCQDFDDGTHTGLGCRALGVVGNGNCEEGNFRLCCSNPVPNAGTEDIIDGCNFAN